MKLSNFTRVRLDSHWTTSLLICALFKKSPRRNMNRGGAAGRLNVIRIAAVLPAIVTPGAITTIREIRMPAVSDELRLNAACVHRSGLQAIEIVDKTAVVDAPEIMKIPQRHGIGFFGRFVLLDGDFVNVADRRDGGVGFGLENHF